uniref:DUF4283 domain-containing protein n=1 Tax=Hordeum vulgare subsp. vulgare TaxID=112509 RepID=A0A8I6X243_HORVV
MLLHVDPARRPRIRRSVTIPSPKVDQAVFFLRNHAVTLSAADGVNASSPMAVGGALEAQLAVPAHSLRVTAHDPEHFFVIFTQPAHQVNVVRRGTIRVDGASFTIASWHEHDHASFDALLLHVRVVIEGVPLQFWSVDGAEEILGKRVRVDRLDSRTLERGHTKTFACWVWTNDVANIPTRHSLGVLPRGAGRVEEMEGFSPPDRRVAPPPATADYEMLIHVDRVEDWAPLSPLITLRLERDPVLGLGRGYQTVPGSVLCSLDDGVEDGQRPERHPRQKRAPVASLGYRGLLRGGQGRDHDGEDNGGQGGGGHRSWKDVLLHRGRHAALPAPVAATRRRSRSPPTRRREREALGRRHGDRRGSGSSRQPTQQGRSWPLPRPPAREAPVAEAVLAEPLEFDKEALDRTPGEALQLDAFSPTLSASVSDFGQFNRATPSAARTLEVQLGTVTSRVCQLEIAAPDDTAKAGSLFHATEPPLLNLSTSAP